MNPPFFCPGRLVYAVSVEFRLNFQDRQCHLPQGSGPCMIVRFGRAHRNVFNSSSHDIRSVLA
jgi:hypothetical protein